MLWVGNGGLFFYMWPWIRLATCQVRGLAGTYFMGDVGSEKGYSHLCAVPLLASSCCLQGPLNYKLRFWFALISVLIPNAASWVICRTSHCGLNNGLKHCHYVPSAWKPAVLQSSWRLQNHDQWLWPVKDGGHRRRNGNSLWDPRICGWGWVEAKCDNILFLWLWKKNTLHHR